MLSQYSFGRLLLLLMLLLLQALVPRAADGSKAAPLSFMRLQRSPHSLAWWVLRARLVLVRFEEVTRRWWLVCWSLAYWRSR